MRRFLTVLLTMVLLLVDIYSITTIVKGKLVSNAPEKQTMSLPLSKKTINNYLKPNVLKVTRSTEPPNKFPPFERTINDPAVVKRVYYTILAFPTLTLTPKLTFCTFQTYAKNYDLKFFQDSKLIMQANFSLTGCPWEINVAGSYPRDPDVNFLPLLANSISLTADELYGSK